MGFEKTSFPSGVSLEMAFHGELVLLFTAHFELASHEIPGLAHGQTRGGFFNARSIRGQKCGLNFERCEAFVPWFWLWQSLGNNRVAS